MHTAHTAATDVVTSAIGTSATNDVATGTADTTSVAPDTADTTSVDSSVAETTSVVPGTANTTDEVGVDITALDRISSDQWGERIQWYQNTLRTLQQKLDSTDKA